MPNNAICPAQSRWLAAWRALPSLPAAAAGVLLMLFLLGWAGQWTGLLLLVWVLAGTALLTRSGERLAAWGLGLRRPTRRQCAIVAPAWSAALTRCSLDSSAFDLYVRETSEASAYSVGKRSVVVTTSLVAMPESGRLSLAMGEAVLVHELGHHMVAAHHETLLIAWLAAPWRCAYRLVLGIAARVAGRQPRRLLGCVVITVVVVAVVQAVQQQRWSVAVLLSLLALCGVICPVADAAIRRREELAADRFAAQAGCASALAIAPSQLERRPQTRLSWAKRVLSGHPVVRRRVGALVPHDYRC